jgi:hypothetical protein
LKIFHTPHSKDSRLHWLDVKSSLEHEEEEEGEWRKEARRNNHYNHHNTLLLHLPSFPFPILSDCGQQINIEIKQACMWMEEMRPFQSRHSMQCLIHDI